MSVFRLSDLFANNSYKFNLDGRKRVLCREIRMSPEFCKKGARSRLSAAHPFEIKMVLRVLIAATRSLRRLNREDDVFMVEELRKSQSIIRDSEPSGPRILLPPQKPRNPQYF